MNHLRSGAWRTAGGSAARRRIESDNDPALAFMLAQQATTRLQFEARRLESVAATAKDPEFSRSEAQIAIDQIAALRARIAPFQHAVHEAIRFEAQEILAALEGVREQFARVAEPHAPGSSGGAAEIVARLMRRRH